MLERSGLSLDIKSGALTSNLRNGPMVLVAIHPYGILDGLVIGNILARKRSDFAYLPIMFFENRKNKMLYPNFL